MFKNIVSGLCDLIFPPHCLICKQFLSSPHQSTSLCLSCQNSVMENIPPFCLKCSRHIGSPNDQTHCHNCKRKLPLFDSAWGSCVYNDSMRRLLHLFKYGNKLSLRHYFGKCIFSFLETYKIDLTQYDMIVPIPLHPVRMRERGYNQSQILAELISQKVSTPLSLNNLIRIKSTQNQARLPQKERWTNVKGAFKIRQPAEFSSKSILLVDDLLTTGATVSEAARILKEAKVNRTDVLTLSIA